MELNVGIGDGSADGPAVSSGIGSEISLEVGSAEETKKGEDFGFEVGLQR